MVPARARPVALVTGAGRRVGIGAGIARRLALDGWDVATSCCTADAGPDAVGPPATPVTPRSQGVSRGAAGREGA